MIICGDLLQFIVKFIKKTNIIGALVNGFVNISITSIEKRYNIQSSESGLILSFYEIASLICILPVTYIGGKVGESKPRWLGWGAIIMGIGAFTFTIPHWISGKYEVFHVSFLL